MSKSPLKYTEGDGIPTLDPNVSVQYQVDREEREKEEKERQKKIKEEAEAEKKRKEQFEKKHEKADDEFKALDATTNQGVTKIEVDGDTYSVDHQTGMFLQGDKVIKEKDIPKKVIDTYKGSLNKDLTKNTVSQNMLLLNPSAEEVDGYATDAQDNLASLLELNGRKKALKAKQQSKGIVTFKGQKIPMPEGMNSFDVPVQKSIGANGKIHIPKGTPEYQEHLRKQKQKQEYFDNLDQIEKDIEDNPMLPYLRQANENLKNPNKTPNGGKKTPTTDEIQKEAIKLYQADQKTKKFKENISEHIEQEQGVFEFDLTNFQDVEKEKIKSSFKNLEQRHQQVVTNIFATRDEIYKTNDKITEIGSTYKQKASEIKLRAEDIKNRIAELGEDFNPNDTTPEKLAAYEKIQEDQQQLINDNKAYVDSAAGAQKELDALYAQRDSYYDAYKSFYDAETDLQEEGGQLKEYQNVVGRNHHNLTAAGAWLASSGLRLADGAESFIYAINPVNILGEWAKEEYNGDITKMPSILQGLVMHKTVQDITRVIGKDQVNKVAEDLVNGVEEVKPFEEIESAEDLGMWALNTGANFLPQLGVLAMGPGSIYVLGAAAAGNDYEEKMRSNRLGETNYTLGQIYAGAGIKGGSEILSERFTLGVLNKTYKAIPKDRIKAGFVESFTNNIGRNIYRSGVDKIGEGTSEVFAQIGNNFADRSIYGRNVSLWDGTKGAFASGVLMEQMIKMPRVYQQTSQAFTGKAYDQKLALNVERGNRIQDMLLKEDLDPNTRASLEKKFVDIQVKNGEIMADQIDNMDMMNTAEKQELIDLDVKKFDLKQTIDAVNNDKSLSSQEKATVVQGLDSDMMELEKRKQEIIKPYEDEATRVKKKEEFDQQVVTIKGLAEQMDKPVNIKVGNSADFQDFLTNTQDNVFGISQMEGTVRAMREVVNDPASTREEVQEAQSFIDAVKAGDPIGQRINMIKDQASRYGVMTPNFTEDGRLMGFDIFINEEAALNNGMVNTAAHEFFHSVLYAILQQDVNSQMALGKGLLQALQDEGAILEQGSNLNERISSYTEAEGLGEEILTLTSEALLNNEIQLQEGPIQKIKDTFRRFGQRLGKDITFDTDADVLNFVRDYTKTISEGKTFNKAMLKAMTQGVKGKLIDNIQRGDQSDVQSFSKEASDRVQSIYEDKGVGGAFEIIEQFAPIVNKIVQRRSEAPNFDRQLLTDEINSGKRGIYDLIQAYDPASGVPLAAYINTYLPARAIEASQRILGEEFTDDITERVDVGAEPTVEQAEVVRRPSSKIMLSDRLNVTKKVDDIIKPSLSGLTLTDFKNTPDLTQGVAGEMFGLNPKKLQTNANLTRGEVRSAQTFINKNADLLISMLPDGATASGTSTGVQNVLLKEFYTKTDRAKMAKTGTKAGLPVQVKNKISKKQFLDFFGITPAGQPNIIERNTSAKVIAMARQTSRMLSNQSIRKQLAANPTEDNVKAMLKLGDGRSTLMFSKKLAKDQSEKGIPPIGSYFAEVDPNITDQKAMQVFNDYSTMNEVAFREKHPTYFNAISDFANDLAISVAYDGQQGVAFTKALKNTDFGNESLNEAMKDGIWKLSDAKFKKDRKAQNKYVKLSHDLASQINIPLEAISGNKGTILGFWAGHYNVVGSDLAKVNSRLKKGIVTRLTTQTNSILPKELLDRWQNFDYDGLQGSYASTYKTAYKKIIAAPTLKEKKKLARQYFNNPQSQLQHEYYDLWNSTLEAWLHSSDVGTQEFNDKADFILKLKKANANIGTTGERIMAPSGYIYLPQEGETGTIKFEHLKSSSQQSKESALLIINNKWRKSGRENLQNYKGIYGFLHLFNMVDDATGRVNESGIFRLAKNVDAAKSIYRTDNLNRTLYDDMKSTIGKAGVELVETFGPGMMFSKALENKRNINANTESKGMSAFDFDETLIDKGENTIIATKGSETIEISSGNWPLQGPQLAQQGYNFDFSDFVNVKGGVEGPLMQKFRNRIKKYGIENNYILTARPAEAAPAIQGWLKTQGIDMPIENITGLGNSTGEAKAMWIANKYAEGYNDIYFVDDALPNVKAVADIMDQLDIKGSSVQAKLQFSKNLSSDFNNILEETAGMPAEKIFSTAKARKRGAKKGKFKIFIPPSHEDLTGLYYHFLTKGEKGEQQMKWFEQALIKPLNRAYTELNAAKQSIATDYAKLKKDFPLVRKMLITKTPDGDFTYGDAVRVYLWDKHGYEIPGLSMTDRKNLVGYVNNDSSIQGFADSLDIISKQDFYVAPGQYWLTEDIRNDLEKATGKVGREQYFQEFIENSEIVFSPENMNKIEAIYGSNFREALEDILYRTKTGTNRNFGKNRIVNQFMDFLNGSIGATMFFNARSAVLQTLSTVNFINWSDNNPFKAAAAFANQKQYWKDFSFIFNSDTLKQRRGGLQNDINANELANYLDRSKSPARAAISWLLTKGFLPTQIADSFAISSGGATFYRNRINTYLKEGLTQQEAEQKAWTDFSEVSEATQQSARPDMISQQQASVLGRMILAFQNTPSQYARLIKKAGLDLINGRGDAKTHISKIIYYGAVQNLIFYGLQSALFGMMFGDDDDEEDEFFAQRKDRIANSMIDGILRGSGVGGAVVSTIKNMAIKYAEQSGKKWGKDTSPLLVEALNVSPPIGIKARKLVSAQKTMNYNREVIKRMKTFDIDNPVWSAVGNTTEALTNVPLARLHNKVMNVREAANNENEAWQRVALMLGWNRWDVQIPRSEKIEGIKQEIRDEKSAARKEKQKIKKAEKKIEEEKKEAVVEEQNKEIQKKEKEEGKEVTCAAVNKSGKRCSNKVVDGGSYCTVHQKVEQRKDGKKTQCSHVKSNGKRCKMQTSATSGKCYYHD